MAPRGQPGAAPRPPPRGGGRPHNGPPPPAQQPPDDDEDDFAVNRGAPTLSEQIQEIETRLRQWNVYALQGEKRLGDNYLVVPFCFKTSLFYLILLSLPGYLPDTKLIERRIEQVQGGTATDVVIRVPADPAIADMTPMLARFREKCPTPEMQEIGGLLDNSEKTIQWQRSLAEQFPKDKATKKPDPLVFRLRTGLRVESAFCKSDITVPGGVRPPLQA
jgi:hypothetical protein